MDIEDNFDLDEMSQSAIKEVGNIIAASYLTALSSLLLKHFGHNIIFPHYHK